MRTALAALAAALTLVAFGAKAQLLSTPTAVTVTAGGTFQLALCGVGVNCSGTVGINRRNVAVFNTNVTGSTHAGDTIFVFLAGSAATCSAAALATAIPVSPGAELSLVAASSEILFDTVCVTGATTGDQALLVTQ